MERLSEGSEFSLTSPLTPIIVVALPLVGLFIQIYNLRSVVDPDFRPANTPEKPLNTPHKGDDRAGFTLVEMVSVIAIIALIAAFAAPTLSAIKGNEVSQAVYSVSDTLEQARAYAMSRNTYVYIGVVQDSTTPTGSMVIGVIASNDGTQIFSPGNGAVNSTSFNPITRLLRLDNIVAASLPTADSTGMERPAVSDTDKLGDPSFDQGAGAYSFTMGSYTFSSQPGLASAPGATSAGMLQIDPQGVVSEAGGNPVPFFEIGLKPNKGNQANEAALQIAGLSGAVRIYRP